jgi:sugar phosphate isomerase/epimerase
MWKLGMRYEVLPGEGVLERFENAKHYGFDAIELPGRYFPEYLDELKSLKDRLPLPVSSISLGFRGSLISSDPEVRRQCFDDTRDLFALCEELGAVGVVMPPILHMDGHPRIDNAPDDAARVAMEDELLLDQLSGLAAAAHEHGVALLLEAVNPKETDYMSSVEHAVSICEQINHPGLAVIVDFFHMQWEDQPADTLIRRAGTFLKHVHVAEDSRVEPGPGALDFRPGFAAMKEIGYQGHVVIECRTLSGDGEKVLPGSVKYLRNLMTQ